MTRVMPNGEGPLFMISSMMKKAAAANTTHTFWSMTAIFQSMQLNGTPASPTTQTTLVVDSTTNVVANQVYAINSAVGEQVLVVSASGTTLVVVRGVGTVTGTSLADNDILYLVGTAHVEGSNRPDAVRIAETPVDNYTQIFRNAWAVSGSAAAVKRFVGGDVVAQDKTENAKMHVRDIEYALLFGQPVNTTIGSVPFRKLRGIVEECRLNSRITTAGSTTNYTQLEAALDPCFNYNSDPAIGNKRILFVGAGAKKVIAAIGRNGSTGSGTGGGNNATNYSLENGETHFGLQFQSFSISRGSFDMIEHPLLTQNAVFSKMAIAVDFGGLSVPYLGGRDTLAEEYSVDGKGGARSVADSGQDAIGGSLLTELTLENRTPFANVVIRDLTAFG
jgi:hypothetical protein